MSSLQVPPYLRGTLVVLRADVCQDLFIEQPGGVCGRPRPVRRAQRRVGCDRHAHVVRSRDQVVLRQPGVHFDLQVGGWDPCAGHDLLALFGVEVGQADGPHFAGVDELFLPSAYVGSITLCLFFFFFSFLFTISLQVSEKGTDEYRTLPSSSLGTSTDSDTNTKSVGQ